MNRKTDPENANYERKKDWLQYVTPLLLSVCIFWMQGIDKSIDKVDLAVKETNAMVFKHLTNDEMHTPRSIAVMKPEFTIYQSMRDQQVKDQKDQLCAMNNGILRIEAMVEKHMENEKK